MSALSYRGTVHLQQSVDASALPHHLADALRRTGANAVEVNANRVSFKTARNWLSFGSGLLMIHADKRRMEYYLDFCRLLGVSVMVMAAAAVFVLEVMDSDLLTILSWVAGGWFLLMYAALITGVVRFRGALRQAIASAPRAFTSISPAYEQAKDKAETTPEQRAKRKCADVSTLLRNELQRLQNGRKMDEEPGGVRLVRLYVTCPEPLEAVAGAREVLKALDRAALAGWPQQQVLPTFPAWFIAACAPESSRQDAEQWLAWWAKLPNAEQVKAEEEKDWSLENWLYWMEPQNREWFWWDAAVENGPERIILQLEVTAWPFSWGALRWLLRAAGASAVELQAA